MAKTLVDEVHELAGEWDWPDAATTGGTAQAAYEEAVDLLHTYTGEPDVLLRAMHAFRDTGSRPYGFAGVAYTIVHASYVSGDDYDKDGLALAEGWLRAAQAAAPGRVEIDIVEALIHVHAGRHGKARATLDRLAGQQHYLLSITEMYYSYAIRDDARFRHWYDLAGTQADNPARRLDVQRRAAGWFLRTEDWPATIAAYEAITRLDPGDPWSWHNLSIAYLRTHDVDRAEAANARALTLMDFGNARKIREAIAEIRRPPRRGLFRKR